MSTAQLRELVEGASVVGLTLDQYVQMIDKGILASGEPIELIDGFLVRKDRSKAGEDPMTVGLDHRWAVNNVGDVLATQAKSHGCHVTLQQPIAIPPDGAPEPDGAIVRGSNSDYRTQYPTATDLFCVIEVADSSLDHDRLTKKRVYAKAGVAQYVIINIIDHVVDVYEGPASDRETYTRESTVRAGEVVRFSVGEGRTIDVDASLLLPLR